METGRLPYENLRCWFTHLSPIQEATTRPTPSPTERGLADDATGSTDK